MQKHFFKFRKGFTNIVCSPLILISTNLELAAKYLPNDIDLSITNSEIKNTENGLFQVLDFKSDKNLFIAEDNTVTDITPVGFTAGSADEMLSTLASEVLALGGLIAFLLYRLYLTRTQTSVVWVLGVFGILNVRKV